MKKLLFTLFLTLGLSAALALDLPSQADLVMISEAGAIVGVGDVTNGTLTLELLTGSSGFAKLLVVDAEGKLQTVDVMVNADGRVTLVLDTGFVSLDSLAVEAGVTYDAAVDAELSQTPDGVLDGLPEQAKAGMAGAAEHRADARSSAGSEADGEVGGEDEGEVPATSGLDHAAGVANGNASSGLDTAKGAVEGDTPENDEAEGDEAQEEVEEETGGEEGSGSAPEVGQPSIPTPPAGPARP